MTGLEILALLEDAADGMTGVLVGISRCVNERRGEVQSESSCGIYNSRWPIPSSTTLTEHAIIVGAAIDS